MNTKLSIVLLFLCNETQLTSTFSFPHVCVQRVYIPFPNVMTYVFCRFCVLSVRSGRLHLPTLYFVFRFTVLSLLYSAIPLFKTFSRIWESQVSFYLSFFEFWTLYSLLRLVNGIRVKNTNISDYFWILIFYYFSIIFWICRIEVVKRWE